MPPESSVLPQIARWRHEYRGPHFIWGEKRKGADRGAGEVGVPGGGRKGHGFGEEDWEKLLLRGWR